MFNQLTIIGRLGTEPEVRTIQNSDQRVANLSLATTHTFKQGNERKEETEWHSVVVFNGLVNVVEKYLHKGDTVMIQGRVRTRKWQDQQGVDRFKTEVICNELKMLGQPTGNYQKQPTQTQQVGNQHIAQMGQQLQPQQQQQAQPQAQRPVQQQARQPAQQNRQSQQQPVQRGQNNGYQRQPSQAPQQQPAQPEVNQTLYQQPDSYSQAKDPMF